jgi:two-component system response regulator AdeR
VESAQGPPGPMETDVLLVEDDRGIAGLYCERLRLEGYNVTVASDGESALAAAFSSAPRMVLLDVRLPGMGGLEVLERLRKDARTKQVPVVILTHWEDDKARSRALNLGAQEFLLKTEVRPGELAERLADWLREREARDLQEPTEAAS